VSLVLPTASAAKAGRGSSISRPGEIAEQGGGLEEKGLWMAYYCRRRLLSSDRLLN